MDRIAEGKAETLDANTRFYILSWYLFNAREFRYDEARKLGLSLNVEVEELIRHKILEKRGDYVRFLKPQDRAKNKGLRTDVKEYDNTVDLVQAAIFAYYEGQSAELKLFHQRTGALVYQGLQASDRVPFRCSPAHGRSGRICDSERHVGIELPRYQA